MFWYFNQWPTGIESLAYFGTKLVESCSYCLPAENHKLIQEKFQRIKGTSKESKDLYKVCNLIQIDD